MEERSLTIVYTVKYSILNFPSQNKQKRWIPWKRKSTKIKNYLTEKLVPVYHLAPYLLISDMHSQSHFNKHNKRLLKSDMNNQINPKVDDLKTPKR